MPTELSILPELHVLNEITSPLPLEHTAIAVRITGLVVVVTLSQRFRNPLTKKADLEYLFPLPHEAAVTAFELRVGERVIRASVQEIEQARQQFADARRLGKRASLLEGRRPNLFALQLANIQPGEFILAVSTYQQRLELSDGTCEFVFPMGLTPKYHRPGHPEEAAGVDAPVTLDLSQVGDVEISVEAETGFPSADPASPTHSLVITRLAPTRFHVTLDGAHLPNRDFVLRWRMEGETIQFPSWHSNGDNGYFMATFIPPVPDAAAEHIAREYIFVLDRSGSMSGEPILQAINALRACLRTLNLQDTFSILLFDDRLEWLASPTAVTQTAVEQADARLGKVDGRGGTDILPALENALSLSADPKRSRLVVFLTDGAVSAEDQSLKRARTLMGAARLFTFGIGSSVNRAFLQQLARIGRGEAAFIGAGEDIEEAILRFQDRISFPLLTNLSLMAEGCQIWDVYPAQLPDLYADRPLEVIGRYIRNDEEALPASLVALGERAGVSLEMRSTLTALAPDPEVLTRLWARARVNDLSEQTELGLKAEHDTRAEIIPLAIKASLLTKYTAFLALDSDAPAMPGKSQLILVSQPLPEGVEPDLFLLNSGTPIPPAVFSASLASVHESVMPRMVYSMPSSLSDSGNFETPVESLDLSVRVFNALKRTGITTIGDVLDLLENGDQAVMSIRSFGEKTLDELREKMREKGFLRDNAIESVPETSLASEPNESAIDAAVILRELARSQQLDGSWKNDVELTSAAVLAFVRSGQTTQHGYYRKQVQRAFEWLAQSGAAGFACFLRALALRELADATSKPEHLAASAQALTALPAPADNLQKAALGILMGGTPSTKAHKVAKSLNELRLIVVARAPCSNVTPALLGDDLGQALAAGMAV